MDKRVTFFFGLKCFVGQYAGDRKRTRVHGRTRFCCKALRKNERLKHELLVVPSFNQDHRERSDLYSDLKAKKP